MNEIMYDKSSFEIALLLLVSMALMIELGYRLGLRSKHDTNDPFVSHTGSIQAALLGLLALLLGFTYSQSLSRYEQRSEAVVSEANAIGTAWLRAHLLPVPAREAVLQDMRTYQDLRVKAGSVSLVERNARESLLQDSQNMLNQLWHSALQAAQADPSPITTGLFIQSLNTMIDAFGSREAALNRHVPEVVLFLLYGTLLITACVLGFTAGLAGHRASFVTYLMVGLIVIIVFIIIDLDRPRRGLIEVSQKSMLDLQATIDAEHDGAAFKTPAG
jgi:hypothetical protein